MFASGRQEELRAWLARPASCSSTGLVGGNALPQNILRSILACPNASGSAGKVASVWTMVQPCVRARLCPGSAVPSAFMERLPGLCLASCGGVSPSAARTMAGRVSSSEVREQMMSMCSIAGKGWWKPPEYQNLWSRQKGSLDAFQLGRPRASTTTSPVEAERTSNGRFLGAEENAGQVYRWSDAKRPRICILGGGFGGLYTALQLDSLVWPANKRPQVLVVDQAERFVFKPLLYELLSKEVDQWEIAPRFSELLVGTGVQFLKDKVKTVTPCDSVESKSGVVRGIGGTVLLESGTQIEYDWLLLALGAEPRMSFVPGAKEHALPFATLEDALKVDERLLALERERFGAGNPPVTVVIVGSGYSGVELAATVAQRLGNRGKVQVVDMASTICPSAPAGNREAALRALSSRDVELVLGYSVNSMSSSSGEGRVLLDLKNAEGGNKRELQADLVLWTVGVKALVPPGESGDEPSFPTNGRGQADTDATLRVKGHPRVFAIGDSAGAEDSSGKLLPTTAQVAFQQADYAGQNLWAAINNRPLRPFRYTHLGEMMTLGKYDGAVTPSFGGLTLDGVVGHTARKLAYLYRLPTNEHKWKVGLSWFAKTAIDSIAFAQDTVASILTPPRR